MFKRSSITLSLYLSERDFCTLIKLQSTNIYMFCRGVHDILKSIGCVAFHFDIGSYQTGKNDESILKNNTPGCPLPDSRH